MEELSPNKRNQLGHESVKKNSKRRQQQRELPDVYHLLNKTFEALLDAVFIIDADSATIIRSNRAASEIFGYTQEEMLGRTTGFLHVEEAALEEFTRQLYPAIEKNGYLRLFNFRMKRKDGMIFPTEHVVLTLNNDSGRRIGWVSLVRDVADRRRMENDLHESEMRYRSLFQNNHAVMLLIDPASGDIVDANPAASRFYGYSRKELKGTKISDINVLSRNEVFKEMERAKTEGGNHFYFRHRLANGDLRAVEVYSGPITVHGKQLLYSIIHDITDRKMAEEKLKQHHENLETIIEQRTNELAKINQKLRQEIKKNKQTAHKLRNREQRLEGYSKHLEEANTALRVLLQQREKDKKDLENVFVSNINQLINPYVAKLKKGDLGKVHKNLVNILESNLRDITSPLVTKLSSGLLNLTPMEIRVASLVKQGKTTKETAEIIAVSPNTVMTHRYNLRTKLGLKNKQANLRSYLLSLGE